MKLFFQLPEEIAAFHTPLKPTSSFHHFMDKFRSLIYMPSFFLVSPLGMCTPLPLKPYILNVSSFDQIMLATLRHTVAPHTNLISNGRMNQIFNCCDKSRSPFEIRTSYSSKYTNSDIHTEPNSHCLSAMIALFQSVNHENPYVHALKYSEEQFHRTQLQKVAIRCHQNSLSKLGLPDGLLNSITFNT